MEARLAQTGSTAPGLPTPRRSARTTSRARPDTAARTAASEVVADLVAGGLIAPEESPRAVDIVQGRLGNRPAAASGSRIAAEIAGYVGGILVVAAGAVFLAASWDEMGLRTRCLSLLAGALVLAIAAVVTRATVSPTGAAADWDARRRLAGVFGIGAAALVAGTVGVWLDSRLDAATTHYEAVPFAAYGSFAVLALAAYLFAPTVPGQAAIGFGATVATFSGTSLALDRPELLTAAVLLALGTAWLALAETGRWHEVETGRVVGGALTLIGAQSSAFGGDHAGLAYLLLAVVGIGAFAVYARFRAWPYLAVGVVGLTLAATEAAVAYIESDIGAAAGLLVAGAMLLVTSLVAMRLHRAERT